MVGKNNTNGIIDSDILIDAMNGIVEAIDFLAERETEKIEISIVSAIELTIGCRNKDEKKELQKFLQKCIFSPITPTASQSAFQLIESYHLSHGLLLADALIAATVLERDATLYTKNTRHFQMIPRLAIIRPY